MKSEIYVICAHTVKHTETSEIETYTIPNWQQQQNQIKTTVWLRDLAVLENLFYL